MSECIVDLHGTSANFLGHVRLAKDALAAYPSLIVHIFKGNRFTVQRMLIHQNAVFLPGHPVSSMQET